MKATDSFASWFERATGHAPYAYQRALAETTAPPSVVEVPTGSGKTQALLGAWLYQRREGRAPRRLVYALPMRSLVEQTADVAADMRARLDLEPGELPITVLMGGEQAPATDWRLRPEVDQILVGTIDMLLSRALNRGYAESRFVWPMAFGLLNADCRWVFDEVQLMGPARATSAQLDGLRHKLGTALPVETIWVSATAQREALATVDRPKLGTVLELPDDDRTANLQDRLGARKLLQRVDLAELASKALPGEVARIARERHVDGTRTLVIVNTVERAQSIFDQLQRVAGSETDLRNVLLHSRYRPPERRKHLAAALDPPGKGGSIVVATQVVEAGVDFSSRTLITEPAPFSSVVQRLGRCNRAGEYDEATVLWLDRGPIQDDKAGRAAAAPYNPIDVNASRAALLDLEGSSVSPDALAGLSGTVEESRDDPATLRRRDLIDLFDTSPDLSGMDIDIAPFIREDDDRNVTVFFRDLPEATARIDTQPPPIADELVQVPKGDLADRMCWVVDHVDGGWVRQSGRELAPGRITMLRASDGGYDQRRGWDNRSAEAVKPIAAPSEAIVDGFGSDALTEVGKPQELLAHLAEVASETARLADALSLSTWRDALREAGALHDLGKAHPVFQDTLRRVIDADAHPEQDNRLWAKSGRHGGRHSRPYFRHELASALAVSGFDGAIPLDRPTLTAYLVAAHHGKVRVSIRPAPMEERPNDIEEGGRWALGIVDGDRLPEVETPIGMAPATTLSLARMEIGDKDSWTDMVLRLRDDPELGPFRLAFLEAILRVADWRMSA